MAWQLASELAADVCKLTDRPSVARDRRFREDLEAAVASAPANIAEGFGRFGPRDFARFLRIARGSLLETRNHILKGKAQGYFTDEESERMLRLQSRATGAVTRLMRYLDSCKGKAPTDWDAEP